LATRYLVQDARRWAALAAPSAFSDMSSAHAPLGRDHDTRRLQITGAPLATANPTLVRAAAAELPRVGLEDAFRICLVFLQREQACYEPAAVRWLGRLALEARGLSLAEAQIAAAALGGLPGLAPEGSAQTLGVVLERRGLLRAARALEALPSRDGLAHF